MDDVIGGYAISRNPNTRVCSQAQPTAVRVLIGLDDNLTRESLKSRLAIKIF